MARHEDKKVQATNGKTYLVRAADYELAEKLHEMWEDYTDDIEENALRIAMHIEASTPERRLEVDALLWMAEHLMGSSVAMTMRGWLAEYRATGKLVVRDADGTVKDSLTVASKERQ